MLKNKTIFTISALTIALSLAACQPKEVEKKEEKAQVETENTDLKLIGTTEKLKLNLPDCKGKTCPKLEIERINSNQKFIDQAVDQYILETLKGILTTIPQQEADASPASDAQATSELKIKDVETPKIALEKKVEPYAQSFLDLDAEVKALSANHQITMSISPTILNSDGPIVTVVMNSSNYLGGAHGSSAQDYLNFDLKDKKQVKLKDLIEPNQIKKLEEKAHDAFKAWVTDSQLATSIEEYEQVWKFSLTDNFILSKNGLILQYGEYEIGPYVVGLPRLIIPYDQLQGILKAQYLPQVKVEKTASSEVVVKEKK